MESSKQNDSFASPHQFAQQADLQPVDILDLVLPEYANQILYVSGKLPTYPSPNPTFCPKREVSVNVGLWEGFQVGSFPETYE